MEGRKKQSCLVLQFFVVGPCGYNTLQRSREGSGRPEGSVEALMRLMAIERKRVLKG